MPRTEWGWLITPEELQSWIVHEDDDILAVNKPAHVLCHPSKFGPWSSLVGACKAYTGLTRLHMPSRLDRETSGIVVVAKTRDTASRLQSAMTKGRVSKTYQAIVCGRLADPICVDRPIGKDHASKVVIKRAAVDEGPLAFTEFVPLQALPDHTLVEARPRSGRTHQIRVHAAHIGHPVAGDKLYGPDEKLFLDFIAHGWTPRHQQLLRIQRHALHAARWQLGSLRFEAPWLDLPQLVEELQ